MRTDAVIEQTISGRVRLWKRTDGHMRETKQTVSASPDAAERAKVESWRLHVLIEAGYPLRSPSGSLTARPTCTGASSCPAAAARDRAEILL